MNIGFDARPLLSPHSGIGKYCLGLLSQIESVLLSSYTPFFYTSQSYKELKNLSSILINNEKVIPTNIPKTNYKQLWSNIYLPSVIKKDNIQLFHSFENIDLPFRTNIKKVITIHDLIPLLFPKSVSWAFSKSFNYFIKKTVQSADLIITDSQQTKSDLILHLNVHEKKIRVVHLGIPTVYKPMNEEKLKLYQYEISKKFNILFSSSIRYYLIVGQLAAHKNISWLIDVISKAGLKNSQYIIISPRDKTLEILKAKLQSKNMLNDFYFFHNVEDDELCFLYNYCHALLFPSLYEGFGLPPIECLASGGQVVANNIPTAVELYGNFTPLITSNIDDWITNLRRIHSQNINLTYIQKLTCSETIHNQYSWQEAAKETFNSYKNLV